MGNKPRIRFKGFTEDWEQRKLGNLTQLITKGTTPKVKNIQNGINFIKVENISDDGVISINSYVSEEEHMNYLSRSILANNDILFSIAGTLGRTAIVKSHLLPANTNQALAIIRLNKSVDVKYINTFLKSNAIKTYIRKNPTVGAQPNLSLGQVSDLEINIPNYSEQKKISNLFSKFDLMITLHQCKLEKLKLTKKALLQKLFPKNGEHIPEIRFKGFTDAWEQCKLGVLAEIVRGASPRPISDPKWFDNNSNVGWLRIADVTAQDGRIRYLDQKISELGQEKTRVIKTPHLLLSIAATVGKPVINYVPTGVHDGFLIFLNPKFDILYTFWWLEMFREKWNKYGQPGSQVNLNSDLVKNQVINIPNEKEQEKISSFLEALDKIITLHQRKLERLQEVKKGLLQKMFV